MHVTEDPFCLVEYIAGYGIMNCEQINQLQTLAAFSFFLVLLHEFNHGVLGTEAGCICEF